MKLFVDEQGSDAMRQFADGESDHNKFVSAIARVEAAAAVCRLRKGGRLSSTETALIYDALAAEVHQMFEQEITKQVLDAATALTNRHAVRSLDAIQLGSAIVVRKLFSRSDMRFIASDHELLAAARAEDFLTWDPAV